jgi:hypothetical protein
MPPDHHPSDTPVDAAPDDGTGPIPEPRRRSDRLWDMVGLGLLAVVLRLPAFLSPRHLTFDDGVFASSVIAMRDGGVPFREVFSSQGPLFLPLVYLGDLLGGRTSDAPRVLAVSAGAATTVGLYWCARQISGRASAVLAGMLAATSGSLMWVTGPLAADGPALAFAVFAFGVALSMQRTRSPLRVALLGVLVGATLSTKSLEAPVLLPVGMVLLAPLLPWRALPAEERSRLPVGRTLGESAIAAAAAAVVYLVVTLPFGFAAVWDQSFRYRADAATDREPLGNAAKIFSTLWDRDLVLLAFVALCVAWWLRRRLTRPPTPREGQPDPVGPPASPPAQPTLVLVWLVTTWVWLVLMVSPLWRPHVSAMIPPLVLAVAVWRPPVRVALVAGVLCLPLLWIQLDGLLRPGDYRGAEAEVVTALRQLPEGAWVLSDEPGLAWRAGRRTTDDLVDPSMLRVQQGRYTEDSLVRAATDPRVCAVVVRSPERFGSFPGLPSRLEGEGFDVVARDGPHGVLYVRATCEPEA